MTMLSADAQIRYLVQWFREWSELQRSDFLPILAEKYANKAYVNGILNSMSNIDCRDKPMSLFECRVKLFKEWFVQWTAEQKHNFINQISEIDAKFAEKLEGEIHNGVENNHNNHEINEEEILED
ncbi:unnamed protein product [Phyllotreta striolata]|uniref:Uncharacterized protein n=1 Tax=Phyllotreta striolata TaxID=444603 RepID=A0A9N9XQ21_PHYSR|nr:unnamed protein product [Phyllotreta striolata]